VDGESGTEAESGQRDGREWVVVDRVVGLY
jgi:hypothetical protein